MERKVTGVLMVTVERRSKFMGLWMRFIPVDLNNAKVHCHKVKEFIFILIDG